jgi:hypothetical protein
MLEYPSEEARLRDLEAHTTALAWLIMDVFKNPEENGIVIEDEEKTDDEEDIN